MGHDPRRKRKNLSQLTLRIEKKLADCLNDFCRDNGLVRDIFIQTAIEQMLGGINDKDAGITEHTKG